MSSSRLSGLNIVLLVIAVGSLLFGAYGFIANGDGTPRPPAGASNSLDVGPLDSGDATDDAGEGRGPLAADIGRDRAKDPKDRAKDSDGTLPRKDTTQPEVVVHAVDSDPSDKGNARISGKVVGPDGAAVAQAAVSARWSDLNLEPPAFSDGNLDDYRARVSEFLARAAKETRSTTSDAEGRFSFTGLDPAGSYDLVARTDDLGSGEQTRVAAGDEIVILLSAESLLRGRVETEDGKPVTKFTVRAWRQNRQWEATSRDFDTEDGRFTLPAKSGMMQLEVAAPGFTQGEPRDVQVGGATGDETVIVLQQAAILTGTVSDTGGNPLAEVTVRVGAERQNRRNWGQQDDGASTRTDSKGRYRFDTLQAKETRFTATIGEMSDTKNIELTRGENTLDFTLDVGSIIRVRSTDPDDKPIELDSVWFQQREGRGNWVQPQRLGAREPGLTELAGLTPGEYSMTAMAAGFPAITQDIDVVKGDNEVTLKFANGATLKGTVVSNSGGKISNLGVRLRKDDEERWGGWGTGRYAQVDEHGGFKLGPAEPGDWRIEVYTTGNWTEVYSSTVTLTEGENTREVVVDSGATVIVKVVDETGAPVNWANVQLVGVKSYNQSSNAEGTATLSFVDAGSYTMLATSRGKASSAQQIALSPGNNNLTVTVQAPNCCRLTQIYQDTQASRAGLQVGDLVLQYNGQQITTWRGLGQAIRATRDTDDVVIVVERAGSMLTFNIKGGTLGIEGADGVR